MTSVLDLTTDSPTDRDPPSESAGADVAAELWSGFVDGVAAAITAEFDTRQIDSVLLKGPVFTRLFYDRVADRLYTDTDLLVQSADSGRAEDTLRQLGFVRLDRDGDWMGPAPKYARTFQRPRDGAVVDLHWRLSGVPAAPELLWPKIKQHTVYLEVGGRSLVALDAAASALMVALHNAHHGAGREAAVRDLERAVDRLSFDTWLAAVCLADELGADEAFAAGLRLTEAGDALADRLALDRPASVEMWLKSHPTAYGAWVLDRFTQTPTTRGRIRIAMQVIVPPRVVMYRFFPLARKGPIGLALAYVLRPLRLLTNAGPAVRDWMRARRALRSHVSE